MSWWRRIGRWRPRAAAPRTRQRNIRRHSPTLFISTLARLGRCRGKRRKDELPATVVGWVWSVAQQCVRSGRHCSHGLAIVVTVSAASGMFPSPEQGVAPIAVCSGAATKLGPSASGPFTCFLPGLQCTAGETRRSGPLTYTGPTMPTERLCCCKASSMGDGGVRRHVHHQQVGTDAPW